MGSSFFSFFFMYIYSQILNMYTKKKLNSKIMSALCHLCLDVKKLVLSCWNATYTGHEEERINKEDIQKGNRNIQFRGKGKPMGNVV